MGINSKELIGKPYNPLEDIYQEMTHHVKRDYIGFNFISTALDEMPQNSAWYDNTFLEEHLVALALDPDLLEIEDYTGDTSDKGLYENEYIFMDEMIQPSTDEPPSGYMYGTVLKHDEGDSYSVEISSTPFVDPEENHYFDPVNIYIDYGTGNISFEMEPYLYQPSLHDPYEDSTITMSFFRIEGDKKPKWHTYKHYEDPLGNYHTEEIDNFLTEKEMTSLFLESAYKGSLPGFSKSKNDLYYFSPEEFDARSPAVYGKDYATSIEMNSN